MKKKLFAFTCPACSHSFYMMKDTYLLFDHRDPDYKRLKKGTFFSHQCQNCGALFDLDYPLLVRDPQKGYTLILSSAPADSLPAGSVVTRNARQFLEAFSILDLGLDIQAILPVTRALEQKYGASCHLEDYDPAENMLWYTCNGSAFGVVNSFRHLK